MVPSDLATDRALAFEGVSKRFGKTTLALDDVSWSIGLGARVCLLGPNGAGKSTSIRLLQGALQPSSGWVTLLGAPVNGPGYQAARTRTGIVPQGPGMYNDLTTIEYFELARKLYRRGEIERVIEGLGLGPYRGKILATLSGGYQRRVCLAAALLAGPDLLLLDEPTVGLDPVAAHDVHELLREALAERTTLLCTHNLAEAEALCDEVVILRNGRVILHDSLANLRKRARPRVRLAAGPDPAPLLAALRRRGLDATAEADAVYALVEQPEREVPRLLRGLLADGIEVYECTPIRPSLEEIFLDAVGGSGRGGS